jgi:PAS domain-containing protein
MKDPLSIFVPANRVRLLSLAAVIATVIAGIDWWIKPYVSLGFLYLFPIMIAGGFLSRTQIVIIAVIFSVLDFRNFPGDETVVHILFSSAGLMGTGLFVSELVRGRRAVLQHIEQLQEQIALRADAEGQLQVLVDSSPAAIVTIDVNGKILLAN